MLFIYSCGFILPSTLFHFRLIDSLCSFSHGRFTTSKFSQLFFWGWLNFSIPPLKNIFPRCRILVQQSFYFHYLNISSHCLLVSMVSDEETADNLTVGTLVHDEPLLYCHFPDCIFVFDLQQFDYHVLVWVYPTWSLLSVLDA